MRRLSILLLLTVLAGALTAAWSPPAPLAPQDSALETEVEVESAEGGGEAAGEEHDPFSTILLELTILALVAVAGRALAGKLGQPSVLGELLAGMALGNIGYAMGLGLSRLVMHMADASAVFERVFGEGESVREAVAHLSLEGGLADELVQLMTGPGAGETILMAATLWLFSNLGVVLLLFLVGLESSVQEMRQVGVKALLVAITGVVAPFALSYVIIGAVMPEEPDTTNLFISATLCATSVGITAAVLKDMGKVQTKEAKIILGAAVIDDVLGLIVLAVVVGIVASGGIDPMAILKISALAFGFLGAVVLLGDKLVAGLAGVFKVVDRANLKLLPPLVVAFFLAWAAAGAGLATIVGAFAAGLIVSEQHLSLGEDGERSAAEVLSPLERIFAPVFFVLMGMQVDLRTFADPSTLGLGLGLTGVAIVGKIVAGWAAGKGQDALTIGIGMVPRGEVGLIFAGIGKAMGVVDDDLFAVIVIMVIATTVVAPLGLRWSMNRGGAAAG